MHIKMYINVVYDASTVDNDTELKEALYKNLSSFIARGSLTPIGKETIDDMDYGVQEG